MGQAVYPSYFAGSCKYPLSIFCLRLCTRTGAYEKTAAAVFEVGRDIRAVTQTENVVVFYVLKSLFRYVNPSSIVTESRFLNCLDWLVLGANMHEIIIQNNLNWIIWIGSVFEHCLSRVFVYLT